MIPHADTQAVTFEISLDAADYALSGYPFSIVVHVTYNLDAQGLSCTFTVRNAGGTAAPVGVGFHPYFTVGIEPVDEAEARIPAAGYLEFNPQLAPTGRVITAIGTEWDYRQFQRIGPRRFNHCYLELERDATGMATASLRDQKSGRTIDVVMDRAFSAIVVYTGDAIAGAPRRALAIEPMTCATDAFNHPDWGLKRLLPGETFSGSYTVRARLS